MRVKFPDNEVVIMNEPSGDSNTGSSASASTMSLLIMGDIGGWWGVNSNNVYRELQGRDVDNINVFISSPGGSAKDAFTIYNFLKGHKANVTAYLFGECMSAASVIANAADKVVIGRATVYMAHHGATYAYGKAKDLRKTADTIDTYDSIIEDLYVEKTGLSKDVIHNLLDKENFITPSDALELNLVDEVVDAVSVDFRVDENHPRHGCSYWDDWYYYFDKGEQVSDSPNFAHKTLDIKYMSKSKINKVKNGDSLGGYLDSLVDDYADSNEMERSDVISDVADAAGITSGTVNQIINGSINCPPVQRIEAFAEFFGVEEDEFYTRGREDGCTIYDDTDNKGKNIFNMSFIKDIINSITNKGYKIVDKEGNDVSENINISSEETKEIANKVFAENEAELVNKAKEALKGDLESISNKLDKLDITASVTEALKPFNKKIEDLEVENKKLRTDLDKKVVANEKNAEELAKDKTKPTNSDSPDLEVKEEGDSTTVKFVRTDKMEIKPL